MTPPPDNVRLAEAIKICSRYCHPFDRDEIEKLLAPPPDASPQPQVKPREEGEWLPPVLLPRSEWGQETWAPETIELRDSQWRSYYNLTIARLTQERDEANQRHARVVEECERMRNVVDAAKEIAPTLADELRQHNYNYSGARLDKLHAAVKALTENAATKQP